MKKINNIKLWLGSRKSEVIAGIAFIVFGVLFAFESVLLAGGFVFGILLMFATFAFMFRLRVNKITKLLLGSADTQVKLAKKHAKNDLLPISVTSPSGNDMRPYYRLKKPDEKAKKRKLAYFCQGFSWRETYPDTDECKYSLAGSMVFTIHDGHNNYHEMRSMATEYIDSIWEFEFFNEYGQGERITIDGFKFLNFGGGLSIEDIVFEFQATFVAKSITFIPLKLKPKQKEKKK
jgi:hypothetical protein